MMVSHTKILFYVTLLIALLSAGAKKIITTREQLEAERAKKVVHITHAMEMLKKQLDNHNSGVKILEQRRITSLKNRIQSYKGQIYDATRPLSEEEIAEILGHSGEL